jgi:hypothetical protein
MGFVFFSKTARSRRKIVEIAPKIQGLLFGGWRTQKQFCKIWAACRSEFPYDNVKNLFKKHHKTPQKYTHIIQNPPGKFSLNFYKIHT